MNEDGWWSRLWMWVHMQTHVHTVATKDDVGEIQFCRRRFQRRVVASISFPPQEGLNPVVIHNIDSAITEFIAQAETALDLRRRALLAGGEGVTR